MLRVTVRGSDMPGVVLGSGETLLFGRAPGPEGMSDIYVSTR